MIYFIRNSTRGMKWVSATIERALRLKFTCGTTGYSTVMATGYPLPSIRTLQQRLREIPFEPGILNNVFDLLAIKVSVPRQIN